MSIGLLVLVLSAGGKFSEENRPGFLTNWDWEYTSETSSQHFEAEVAGVEAAAAPELPPEEVVAAPVPIIVPMGPLYQVIATHYGVAYNGRTLGCGTGYYTSENPSILAVGPTRSYEWPGGTVLEICGHLACNLVVRQDACPGCSRNVVDLSESGLDMLCGYQTSTCRVTIQKVMLIEPEPPPEPEPSPAPIAEEEVEVAATPEPAPTATPPPSEEPAPEVERDTDRKRRKDR